MAKKMGPDGLPIDVPTVPAKNKNAASSNASSSQGYGGDEPTIPPEGKGAMRGSKPSGNAPTKKRTGGGSLFPDDVPTVPGGRHKQKNEEEVSTPEVSADVSEPKTQIFGGRKKAKSTEAKGTSENNKQTSDSNLADPMSAPVAGWLVIIKGPGMGHVMQVSYGQNSIGRDNNERIKVNFGDEQISRKNHAVITFDPRGKQFYISQGTGSNLAYMNDAPVLAPTVLEANCEIILGETTFRFVPFCSPDFSWDDVED